MREGINSFLTRFKKDRIKRRKMMSYVGMLSLIVVISVVMLLKFTGITMTNGAYCGYDEHTHTEDCVEKTLVCGLEESEEHTHTDECYEEKYICEKPEHIHTAACYPNKEADVETASDWEADLPELTGVWSQDLVSVSASQIGYTESTLNYEIAEDGTTKQGYTRYGQWYGNPYGDWSAMFASFCLNYADIPTSAMTHSAGAETMMVYAKNADILEQSGEYTPAVGDLVFLDKNLNGTADSVGIISDVYSGSFTAIEGDSDGAVKENDYNLTSGLVLGYVNLDDLQGADGDENVAEPAMYSNGTSTQASGITVTFKIPSGTDYTSHIENYSASDWPQEYTIDSGTSLSESNYSLPRVSVINVTGSSNEYISSYSWITSDGMICNDDTVFDEDTTLNLCLYKSSEIYSLEFVCGETDGGHSVTYAVSGYPSATMKLGQSVSAPYLPTAADVNAKYKLSWCNRGSKSNETFVGWYVKNSAGENVEFTAGVPVTSDYVDSNYGNSIRVYAKWEEAKEQVTVTFRNGTEVSSWQMNKGDAIGTLPEAEYNGSVEGVVFMGWQYTDTDGSQKYASEDMIINSDMEFTAIFGEPQYYTVEMYDVTPDGDMPDTYLDVMLMSGETMREYMEELYMEDGENAADLKWYTVDSKTGEKTAFDIDAPVTSDLKLYTYSYRLTLNIAESDVMTLSSVDVSDNKDGSKTIVITARVGEKLSASDFVIDGVDYSLYTWKTDSGQTIDIQNLIKNGLDGTITATGSKPSVTSKNTSFNFYVCIDNEWQLVSDGPITLTEYKVVPYYYNYYYKYGLTAAQLESIYKDFGLTADMINSTSSRYILWATTGATYTVPNNSQPTQVSGVWYIPTDTSGGTRDFYYMPKTTLTGSSSRYVTNYTSTDTFYTVKVQDNLGLVYSDSSELPKTRYVLTGNTATITVDNGENGAVWQCVSKSGRSISGTVNTDDNTTTFTIRNISEPYTISTQKPEGTYEIRYEIEGSFEQAGSYYGASKQEWWSGTDAPTVNGKSPYSEIFDKTETGNYVVKAPDKETWISRTAYGSKGDQLFTYTFKGWEISYGNSQTVTVNPGDVLTPEQLAEYASDDTIILTSLWKLQYPDTTEDVIASVGFYVNVTGTIQNAGSSGGSVSSGNFADCLYTTEVIGGQAFAESVRDAASEDNKSLLLGTTFDSAYEVDKSIRKLETEGYEYDGETIKLRQFPSDEAILARLRSWASRVTSGSTTITIDGKTVNASDLTPDKYTIRWYVFKYEGTDGWHIDGILVQRTGKLTVTKTFDGDDTAIEAIKSGNYNITLTKSGSYTAAETLTLDSDSYTAYDSATDTYTWVVDVQQNTVYTARENNYISSISGMNSAAEYIISNPDDDVTENRWQTYTSSGVSVTGYSYPSDLDYSAYQTLSFRNSYVPVGTLAIRKLDYSTGKSLKDVTFGLTDENGNAVTLYREKNEDGSLTNRYYLMEPSDVSYETVTNGQFTTDSTGVIYLMRNHSESEVGRYILTELSAPSGYILAAPITINVTAAGISSVTSEATSGWQYDSDSITLTIGNRAETGSLTVKKVWASTVTKPVTVQLYRNGVSMGSTYSAELKSTNRWTHTWDDLPLYIDGTAARYTIRETKIGDTNYDASIVPDGYSDYVVSYDSIIYKFSDGSTGRSPSKEDDDGNTVFAESAELTVRNSYDSGQLIFDKVDNTGAALPGATFTLYGDEERTQIIATAVSGSDGKVIFESVPTGSYVLETEAPEGFKASTTVYNVTVTSSGAIMKDPDGNTVTSVVNNPDEMRVILQKLASDGSTALPGAQFELYRLNSDNTWEKQLIDGKYVFESDNNGQIVFSTLMAGKYKLVETKAPAGYYRLTDEIIFNVSSGNVTLEDSTNASWSLTVPGAEAEDYIINVINRTGTELPKTGGTGTIMFTVGGLAVISGGILLLGYKLRRKKGRGAGA